MPHRPSFSLTIRAKIDPKAASFTGVLAALGEAEADVEGVDVVRSVKDGVIRDISVLVRDPEHGNQVTGMLAGMRGVTVVSAHDRVTRSHLGGKMTMRNRAPLTSRDDLSMAYTPGVARVCMAIHDDPERTWDLTIRGNSVAVITDGSSVVGQGDLGALAALPAAEAKCMFLREMAGIDGFPLPLDVKGADEVTAVVSKIVSVFAGVHITDMAAPECFEVQKKLGAAIDVPVLHDVQEGTAASVLAALINGLGLAGKTLENATVVVAGLGPSGVATARLLAVAGVGNVIAVNRDGAVHEGTHADRPELEWIRSHTNPEAREGDMRTLLTGADAVVGLTRPGVIGTDDVKQMANDPIVMALAMPDSDISRDDALAGGALAYASGRPDLPNQITSGVAFPGIWRGTIDCRATRIDDSMVLAAASAIAETSAGAVTPEHIVPSVFNTDLVPNVARAVREAAEKAGLARVVGTA